MIEGHMKLRATITSAPIENLDAQAQKLLKRINGNHCDADSGFSGEKPKLPKLLNCLIIQSLIKRVIKLIFKLGLAICLRK